MLSTASVQLSVYLSPSIFDYAVKFCLYADHAAVSATPVYVRTYVGNIRCVYLPPLGMDNYFP